jgi:peptidoglycan/xylan/chitin deacetylase (PgdA/CDA1 family)
MSCHSKSHRIVQLVVLTAVALLGISVLAASPGRAATNTTVSLTFDDGHSSHAATLSMLSQRGMTGTYYINSAMVGTSSYYMTWPQIHALADAGNEIGGHTLHHKDLTKLNTTEATTEACDDRTNLINNGFAPVTSFAYPYAANSATAEQIVQGCGYGSGRDVGSIYHPTECPSCPYAETIPPRNPYALRTPEPAVTGTTLAELQAYVTNTETHGGGWVILVFHGICDNSCTSSNSLSPSVFTAFLDWLQPRSASGTVVRTVGQVMGGTSPPPPGPDTTPPTTTIACNGGFCSNWYKAPVSVSLTATDSGGSGVDKTLYTTDGSDPAISGTTYLGPFTIAQTSTVRFLTTDKAGNVEPTRSQLIQLDTAAPTVSITAPSNGSSVARGSQVTLAATATDNGSGVARVAFFVDGKLLGTDTTPPSPYQVTWNTRKTSFGQHTLTAVATDTAGNGATSAGVTINITH